MLLSKEMLIKQEYLSCSQAVQKAQGHYVYFDLTSEENRVESFSSEQIYSLQMELECCYKLAPIFHGDDCLPLSHKVEGIRRAAIERVKQEIKLSALFQAPLVTHGGQTHMTVKVDAQRKEELKYLINSLNELCEYASSQGIELWIENLANYKAPPFSNVFSDHHDISTVLECVPGLQLLYDIGHSNVNQGYSSKFFYRHFERIKAISLSDNNGLIDSHSRLGTGIVDFKKIFQDINLLSWEGLLIFETRGCSLEEDIQALQRLI